MASILIVDDQPDTIGPLRLQAKSGEITVSHPQDVTVEDLARVDLVLVDYRLDEWPEREELVSIALKPPNGLTLASILRGHAETLQDRPTAFALHAADLTQLSAGITTDAREHIVARLHNLEWAFRKTADRAGMERIRSLATAVVRLPNNWPKDDPVAKRALLRELLGLTANIFWMTSAEEDIESCNPPIHDLATATHGLSFLRWVAQRILPYPTFLLGDLYLAARLGVEVESLRSELTSDDSALAASLDDFRYRGILHDFVGPRWWRAGLNAWSWQLTRGNPFDRNRILEAVQQMAPKIVAAGVEAPVVAVDEQYRPASLVDEAEAVTIHLDDWPLFADAAWIPTARAAVDPVAADMVVTADRELIGTRG